jgi:hypothetical protein
MARQWSNSLILITIATEPASENRVAQSQIGVIVPKSGNEMPT